jgi:branched-chain amino acid transport system permease protein
VVIERFIIHPNNRILLAIGTFLNSAIFRPLGMTAFDNAWRGLVARFRGLAGNEQGQVLMTLGISFIVADLCLLVWTGDPMTLAAPAILRRPLVIGDYTFPTYRLAVLGVALVAAAGLYFLMERTRLGAMIRAGVDDREMARGVGIPVSRLFTTVFLLGATLAGFGGVLGGPILNAYPGLDTDMLPLALIVVILGGAGSLLGAFVGSFVVGFLYNFGIALVPDLAYFVLFLPMVLVLVFLPQGLFGRVQL